MKKTPIEETVAVQIIELYQQGHTTLFISSHFSIPYSRVYSVLHQYNIPMRKPGGVRTKSVQITVETTSSGKYDHINFEPRAKGMDYKDYLKQQGITFKKRNWS